MRSGLICAALLLHAGTSTRLHAQTFEQRLLAVPDTGSVRQMSRDLSAVPHMAGTPAQAATRDYVVDRMKSWGIDAKNEQYGTWRDWTRGPSSLTLVAPRTRTRYLAPGASGRVDQYENLLLEL